MVFYNPRESPPVDKLPVELLSYIFTLSTTPCSGNDDPYPADPLFDADATRIPHRVSSVCRHWRRVAWETPTLWTHLCATIGSVHEFVVRPTRQRVTLFDTSHFLAYLKLSRNRPVDILLDARDPEYDFGEPELDPACGYTPAFSAAHMEAALQTLIPYKARWRSLTIMTDTWSPMHTALRLINPLDAPLLERLTLMRCNDYISHAPHFEPARLALPLEFASKLSALRHLTLHGVPTLWETVAQSLPHLESLDITSLATAARPTLEQMHAILSPCASTLKRLRILNDADISLYPPSSSLQPISLPSLTHLSLGFRSDACPGLVESGLVDAPQLRNLMLECETYPGDIGVPDGSGILACFADASVKLDSVTLKAVCASGTLLQNVIRGAGRGVRHLEMERMPNVNCLIDGGAKLDSVDQLTLMECEGMDWGTLRRVRDAVGANTRIDVYVEGDLEGEDGGTLGWDNVVVHQSAESVDDDEGELPSEEEAFCLGGTFNDPVFDAMFSMQTPVSAR